MQKLKIKNSFNKGFSLTEIILTMIIMITIFAISIPFISSRFSYFSLSVERDRLVANLRRARILAMTNRNSLPHGLYITPTTFYIFEGNSFNTRNTQYDEDYERKPEITISGPSEIVFSSLSGTTSSSTFNLVSQNNSASIVVNPEGAISYY